MLSPTLMVAGTLGLGAGGYLLYRAHDHDRAAEDAPTESAFDAEHAAGDRARRWGTIACAAGGAVLVTGLIRYVVVRRSPSDVTVGIRTGSEPGVVAAFTW